MNAASRERVELAGDLRFALEREQLEVHYQPQVKPDGTLVGYEALLRWRHPVHGYIPPAKFIPIAEESGLIPSIGRWVLETACRQTVEWRSQGREVRIAVNISAVQLAQVDFVPQVLDAVVEAGLEAEALELELTESLLVGDSEDVARKLRDLRAAGIRVAIDDFGTGYSSLSYLQQLPIDSVKIDRSFVSMIDAPDSAAGPRTAVIRAIMSLARDLNLTVTAEGVETAAQHWFLQELGCHQLQGYRFGKPRPASDGLSVLAAADLPILWAV